jgi:prephenate dehydrogenase
LDAARARVQGLWSALGARVELIDAVQHDQRMAWISHLPQITASALANALLASGHPRSLLGPGGRDATRLAGSQARLWSAICEANRDPILDALGQLQSHLQEFRTTLERGDRQALEGLLNDASRWAIRSE